MGLIIWAFLWALIAAPLLIVATRPVDRQDPYNSWRLRLVISLGWPLALASVVLCMLGWDPPRRWLCKLGGYNPPL